VFWIVICLLAWNVQNANQFYGLAVLVGVIMGGSQSLSRSTFAKLIPDHTEDTASFFSFFDVTEKVSIVIGTASYGLIEAITGTMRNSILGLIAFFGIGLLLLVLMPNSKALKPVLNKVTH
jgi:UMF1 family MFS transporter